MITRNKSIYWLGIIFLGLKTGSAQCPTDLLTGQNLLTNGDFSDDYNGWTYTADPARTTGYLIFNPPITQNYSSPGFIYAGTKPSLFNSAFPDFNDHSTSSDNKMLMVDGICQSGIKLWSQPGIPIKPNTAYYFSIWVHSLKDGNNPPGTLQFDVNGQNLTPGITAPTDIASGWVQFEATWNSGPTPPATATISIENTTTTGCASYVDFAIDDITFIPGCKFAATGPQPDLGPDLTLCGRGGSPIVLNANVPKNATTTVTWSDGTTNTGSNASFYTKSISTAGTYSVCVTDNGSCVKSDVIVISNTFTLALPTDIVLCDPPSALLDPGFNGIGVTFKWEKSSNNSTWTAIPGTEGVAATYTANTPGYYRVTATDPICGAKTSNVCHITTQQTATPVDAYFCPTSKASLAITNATGVTYNWYASDVSTAILGSGTTFTTPNIAASTTYYVEDASVYSTKVGESTIGASYSQTSLDQYRTQFLAKQSFTIDSVTVYWFANNSNPNDVLKVQFQLTDDPSGTTTPSPVATGVAYSTTNALANAAGQMKPPYPTSASQIYAVRVPVKITVPSAGSYRLTAVSANTTGNVQIQNGGSYVYTDAATLGNIVSITGTQQGGNPVGTSYYGGMYNWKINYKLNCKRIPVNAIANCTLPLEFVSFEVNKISSGISLEWILTGTEGSYFSIERSRDQVKFDKIGTQVIDQHHKGLHTYQYIDRTANGGLYYYRIVRHNLDGSVSISNVRTTLVEEMDIQVSPNPSLGVFNVTGVDVENEVLICVYNTQGIEVLKKLELGSEGASSIQVDLGGFDSGIYFLTITTASGQFKEKIIKR